MRYLRFSPDYFAFPVWDATAGGMVDPSTLPVDSDLVAAISVWAERFDDTLDPTDPLRSGFETTDAEAAFRAAGIELARRLQDQLGPEYSLSVDL